MRRVVLIAILASSALLTVLCGAGAMLVRAGEGLDLVVSGASEVRITRHGTARLQITYTLPPNASLRTVSRHLVQHGWRRVAIRSYDSPGPVFTRLSWFGVVREVAIVNSAPTRRQTAEISVARCFRFAGWVQCPP